MRRMFAYQVARSNVESDRKRDRNREKSEFEVTNCSNRKVGRRTESFENREEVIIIFRRARGQSFIHTAPGNRSLARPEYFDLNINISKISTWWNDIMSPLFSITVKTQYSMSGFFFRLQ